MTACRYFDGLTSRPAFGTLVAAGDGVELVVGETVRREAGTTLTMTPSRTAAPSRLAFADGAVCEIADPSAAATLFAALHYRPGIGDRIAARRSTLATIIGVFVTLSIAIYLWGIPFAATVITDLTPMAWQKTLGDRVLAQLDRRGVLIPSYLPPKRRDALRKRAMELHFPGERPRFVIEFRSFEAPNALALPGDTIIVSDELIALAKDDDAVMTVIAHELSHLQHRDAMRGIAEGTLVSALAAWYIGDASTIAATATGALGGLHFARESEHRADLDALHLMQASGIPTQSAADLFRALRDWKPPKKKDAKGGAKGGAARGDENDEPSDKPPESLPPRRARFELPAYLSTHPATADRIRLFETGND